MDEGQDIGRQSAHDAAVIESIKARFTDIRCSRVMHLINIIANPVRIHILCALTQQPFSVTELVEIADSTLSNVSQQLKMMWMAGYVEKERRGKQIVYRLADQRISELIAFLEGLYPAEPEGCVDAD